MELSHILQQKKVCCCLLKQFIFVSTHTYLWIRLVNDFNQNSNFSFFFLLSIVCSSFRLNVWLFKNKYLRMSLCLLVKRYVPTRNPHMLEQPNCITKNVWCRPGKIWCPRDVIFLLLIVICDSYNRICILVWVSFRNYTRKRYLRIRVKIYDCHVI